MLKDPMPQLAVLQLAVLMPNKANFFFHSELSEMFSSMTSEIRAKDLKDKRMKNAKIFGHSTCTF